MALIITGVAGALHLALILLFKVCGTCANFIILLYYVPLGGPVLGVLLYLSGAGIGGFTVSQGPVLGVLLYRSGAGIGGFYCTFQGPVLGGGVGYCTFRVQLLQN